MAYRPYPNADRALRQLARGCGVEPPTGPDLAAAVRGVQPSGREFGRALSQAFAESDTYVLSSRRPGVVGGPA